MAALLEVYRTSQPVFFVALWALPCNITCLPNAMNEEKCHPDHLVCLQGGDFYYRRSFQPKELSFKEHILEHQWLNTCACYKRPQTVDIKDTQRLTSGLEARMFQRSSMSSMYFSIQPLWWVLHGAAYSTGILLIVSIPTGRCSFLSVCLSIQNYLLFTIGTMTSHFHSRSVWLPTFSNRSHSPTSQEGFLVTH